LLVGGGGSAAPLSEAEASANPNAAALQSHDQTSAAIPPQGKDSVFVNGQPYGGGGQYVSGTPEEIQDIKDKQNAVIKAGASAAGAEGALALVPEATGGGLISYLTRILGKSSAAGVGAGVGNSAGQAASGQDPTTKENLEESALTAGATALVSAPLEAIGELSSTKLGRSAINQSLGAQTRDVTYGNPARAITQEGIGDVTTGDLEAYKDAVRAGKSPSDAAKAAGGRFAAVQQRIEEWAPRLDNMLKNSQSRIPVSQAIDKPLHDAAIDVINNSAMTDPEKDVAIIKLGDLQKSLKQGLGSDISPYDLNTIKQKIGNRVNWGGTTAVTDEVKPAYKALYSSMNQLINGAVPEAREANSHLSNLLAAASDIKTLMAAEEVGRGGGVFGGKIGSTALGLAERSAGRVLPGISSTAKSVGVGGPAAVSSTAAGLIHFTDSEGDEHSIPPDRLDDARKIDPGLKIHE
jgi:hypothetical protein